MWEGDCLVWTGATNGKQSYGKMWDGARSEYVHRIAYRVFIGDIPAGLTIDHVRSRGCRSRLCVNPEHLEAVTMAEQHARRPRPTHCPQGHEYDTKNMYEHHNGKRKSMYCRRCHADREKAIRDRARSVTV